MDIATRSLLPLLDDTVQSDEDQAASSALQLDITDLRHDHGAALQRSSAATPPHLSLAVSDQLEILRKHAVVEAWTGSDNLFRTGFGRFSRLHRVVGPLSVLLDIFDMAVSSVHREALSSKSHFCFTICDDMQGHLWLLKNGLADRLFCAPNDVVLRIAAFEISLDFDQRILRFSLRPPPGHHREDAGLAYVDSWRKLLVAAKAEQAQDVRTKALALPALPWRCCGVLSMPCVFWVHVPRFHAASSIVTQD